MNQVKRVRSSLLDIAPSVTSKEDVCLYDIENDLLIEELWSGLLPGQLPVDSFACWGLSLNWPLAGSAILSPELGAKQNWAVAVEFLLLKNTMLQIW